METSKARVTPMMEWNTIPWHKLERRVFKLQKRIFKASQRGDVKAVHRLQKTLMRSWSAKCLAVRQVTQDHTGRKTAGIDGVKQLPPSQRLKLVSKLQLTHRAQPVRRVFIPKPGSQEQLRPDRPDCFAGKTPDLSNITTTSSSLVNRWGDGERSTVSDRGRRATRGMLLPFTGKYRLARHGGSSEPSFQDRTAHSLL